MLRFILGVAVAGAAYYLYRQKKLLDAPGSTTNASEAVDDIKRITSDSSSDDVLDAGLEESFPASDPVAVGKAYNRR
jgi:hypothetical protein